MATTEEDLQSFSQFVRERVGTGKDDSQLPELFDLRLLQTPGNSSHAKNITAVNAAINDFMSGERGTPAGEHSRHLRDEYGVHEQ